MNDQEEMNKEVDISQMTLTIEVGEGVISQVREGSANVVALDVTEENQDDLLAAPVDSCYLYNNGACPFAVKGALAFLLLDDGKDKCLTRIIGVETEAGSRFSLSPDGSERIVDPLGDSCVWEVQFEVVPVPEEPRHYLMRWNPTVSTLTEKGYEDCLASMVHGMFRINWSIFDWQEARRGDFFYMLRTGDDKAGIAFYGQFISDPYPDEDWKGSTRRRMYVDMVCMAPGESEGEPLIALEELQKAIPSINWEEGHSGILLSEEEVGQLSRLPI